MSCILLIHAKNNDMPTKNLTLADFKEKVFDFENEKEWKFKGEKPAVIDFYADWCGPCKMVAPIFEELSNEIPAIDIYKVDTEAEQQLSAMFGIRSIPSILFIPSDGRQPMMQAGALPKNALEEIIEKELLNTAKA
jgi:thioredoxin 1